MSEQILHCDTAIAGGGIAGLVAALELLQGGQTVVLADADTPECLGGLARSAFGGMALVGTPEQKLQGIADTPDIAYRDWCSFADFGEQDDWPKAWARCYVDECIPMVYQWLKKQGLRFFPAVNWVERGLYGDGNSLPRYHILWGTGQHLVDVVIDKLKPYVGKQLTLMHQGRVKALASQGQDGDRQCITGFYMEREESGDKLQVLAHQTIIASGGINGSTERVRQNWYKPWGEPPSSLLNGANPIADGCLHDETRKAGGRLTHLDKMWNYAAGVPHPQPHFPGHGLSLIPCKSALWLNHQGRRIGPEPLVTGFDTNFLCQRVAQQEKPWTWQVMNWRIAVKELAISGAEHNVYIRDRKLVPFLWEALHGNQRLVKQMLDESEDFIAADDLESLVTKMNALTDEPYIDPVVLSAEVQSYDSNFDFRSSLRNDDQIRRIDHARQWFADRSRTCKPAAITDPSAGPLIAVRTQLISRKSLGGIQTDLQCRVLSDNGEAIPGLYAVGEAAGFGGGGANGFRSLEGTFLPGCILTARKAAQAICSHAHNHANSHSQTALQSEERKITALT